MHSIKILYKERVEIRVESGEYRVQNKENEEYDQESQIVLLLECSSLVDVDVSSDEFKIYYLLIDQIKSEDHMVGYVWESMKYR